MEGRIMPTLRTIRRWLLRSLKWLSKASATVISILVTVAKVLPVVEFVLRHVA
jgi:hypothetical protein